MKKRSFVLCSLVLLMQVVFAMGSKDNQEIPVENPEGFQEYIDINEHKKGKYNFFIEANDKGGNTTTAGPHNIYIDPESDLPIVGFTNPRDNMRIPGNLNIVGTCVDDDAVAYVELIFNGDRERVVRAEGAGFWSYYLDTSKMEDGLYSITAWGVDINGLKGREKTVYWNLDRKKPDILVESHELGQLVNGKIALKGSTYDGNQVASLAISEDDGKTYRSVKIDTKKKSTTSTFNVAVDTKKFEDGPKVLWFKAQDKMGTTGLYSYLMYVDNTKPDVKIVYPEPGQEVNGIFSVSGYARDEVGLESLSWQLGKESGDFDLAIGNPWWVKTFDIRGEKTSSLELIIKAVDVSGNISVDKYKIPVNQNADLPIVELIRPELKEVFYGDTIYLNGKISDDDGVQSLFVAIDGGEAQEFPSTGSFQLQVSGIEPGVHSVSVWAKDIYDVIGPRVVLKEVVVAGDAPEIAIESLTTGAKNNMETKDFVPGLEIHPEVTSSLKIRVSSGAELKRLSWNFGSQETQTQEIKAKTKGVSELLIPIPQNVDYGTVPFTISVVDIYDREAVYNSLISTTDLSVARGDTKLVIKDARLTEGNTIVIDKERPVFAYLLAGKAVDARLSEETEIVRLKRQGNTVQLEAGSEYGFIDLSIIMKSDRGFEYSSQKIRFINPAPAPQLSLENTAIYLDRTKSEKEIRVGGSFSAHLPLDSLSYRIYGLDNTSPLYEGIIQIQNSNDGHFDIQVPKNLPFGPLAVEVIAQLGEEKTIASCSIYKEDPYKDPYIEDPKIKIPPVQVQWIQAENVYYFVNYQGNVNSYTLNVDGKAYEVENQERCGFINTKNFDIGVHTVDLSLTEEGLKAPKVTKFSYKFTNLPKKASISFQSIDELPWQAGSLITMPQIATKQQNILTALVVSDEAVASATWTVGSIKNLKGSLKKISDKETELSLILPQGLPADRLPIEVEAHFKTLPSVKAVSELVVVRPIENRLVSNTEDFFWANPDLLSDGSILLEKNKALYGFYVGKEVKDVSFIKEQDLLSVSVEEGLVVLKGLKDGGVQNLSLRIRDIEGWTYETKPFSILVDSYAPELAILSPEEGLWVQDSVDLEISAEDANEITSFSYSLDLGATWKPLFDLKTSINLLSTEDGAIGMAVRAVDKAGRETIKTVSINKDTIAPQASFVVPVAEARVNGENTIGIHVKEAGKLLSATYISPEGERLALEPDLFITTNLGTQDKPMENGMSFEFVDASGNVSVLKTYPFIIDQEMDLPVVEVNLPEENEVLTTDFVISGIVYDDDKPARIYYQIDDGEEIAFDCETGYSVTIPLSTMTDNEHYVVVTPEDIYGVKGHSIRRNFRISLEEPKASVISPRFDETISGIVHLEGVASDKNDIAEVYISLDNGNTFNLATGTTEWSYRFDSIILEDGTNVVFIKVFDKYGIEALYSSLINVDNTSPVVFLESPKDGSTTVGPVFISGRATDSIHLESLTMNVRSLQGEEIPENLQNVALGVESILTYDLDLSNLPDGLYNIDITAVDAADNKTKVSRNINLAKEGEKNFIECLYPLDGESVQGRFNLYGYLGGADSASTASLMLNGNSIATTEVAATGFFKFALDETLLPEGELVFEVKSDFDGKANVTSEKRTIMYTAHGPWISVDSLAMGDYAFERPWLSGRAGYVLSAEDEERLADKATSKEEKAEIRAKKLKQVELSFDNGKTFTEVKLGKEWKYRLETQDMVEGMHYLVLRSVMENGEVAVTRMLVQIDNTPPTIKLIAPQMGGHYNQELEFTALINDDIELRDAKYVLRKGDKAAYEVPGFIQGLYFDFHFWGGTLWDIGLGLTFFDDNVKLQVQYGQFTQDQWNRFTDEPMRYGGNVFGAKLLANIYYLPFSYLFGPDFDWLSLNFALGANYSYFSETQSGKPQMMSAVLAQLEFPRVTMKKWKYFRTFAFYTEGQFWFVPTDVNTDDVDVATFIPHITCGLRVNLF